MTKRHLKMLVNLQPFTIIEDEVEYEECDATLFNLGGTLAILSQFRPQDSRRMRWKAREQHKRLA